MDLDVVVGKLDKGDGRGGGLGKPEVEGDVELPTCDVEGSGVGDGIVRTNHAVVALAALGRLSKLIVDLEPLPIDLIDLGPADLDLTGFNEGVPDVVDVGRTESGEIREVNLEVHGTDEIAVTRDSHGEALAEIDGALINLLHGLYGKGGVLLVNGTEKRDFRIAGKVSVLSANGNELHNTTRHVSLFFI